MDILGISCFYHDSAACLVQNGEISAAAQECPKKDIMCVQKTGPIDVYEVVAIPSKPEVEE